jgi:hypothetical protein
MSIKISSNERLVSIASNTSVLFNRVRTELLFEGGGIEVDRNRTGIMTES